MDSSILGAWSLKSCVLYKDEDGTPTFGDPPSGQIQYTSDGRMSGFLMDPEWAARGAPEANSFTEFFAYAGTWKLEGDKVHHTVMFASSPARVGTVFTRNVSWLSDNKIELTTEPETSKSGKVYVTKLIWERVRAT